MFGIPFSVIDWDQPEPSNNEPSQVVMAVPSTDTIISDQLEKDQETKQPETPEIDIATLDVVYSEAEMLESLSPVEKNKSIVREIASQYGWDSGAQWEALQWIIFKESSWNNTAQNSKSTAYGLFQFLDATWAGYGCQKSSDTHVQAQCGLKYIQDRYGSPTEAQKFHKINNWY